MKNRFLSIRVGIIGVWIFMLCHPLARASDVQNPGRVYIPATAGLINVRNYGLRGDGKTDDTAALLRLVRVSLNQHKTLFFPAGTYLLSDSIPWANEKGEFWPWLTWQGEGRARTILRLRDRAKGFGSPARPKALIKTGCYDGETRQNAAFNCYLFDLTINTGRGNPGAIALDYCSNNNGAVVRVDILSEDGAGVSGLSMTRDSSGPALIQHVRITGFDTGIAVSNLLFGMTFEYLHLARQKKVGIEVSGHMASIRRLTSINRVPAVRLRGWASAVVLLDSQLSGGAPGQTAISVRDAPTLLLRNVRTTGYKTAAKLLLGQTEKTTPGGQVKEALTGERFTLFGDGASGRTLNLPVAEAPSFFGERGDWVSVGSYGAKGDGKTDCSRAIQQAIDSGKAVVYFPAGVYRLSTPAVVRGKVRRVIGFSSSFADARGKVMFRFENTKWPVSLERFCFLEGGRVENAATQPVTLRHITGPEKEGVVTSGSGRSWFFEDVCTSHFLLTQGTTLYARQLNCEPEPPGAGFVNEGGLLWILGLKSEWGNTIGVTCRKGRTEVLGGLMLPAQGFKDPETPAFVIEDSAFSATWNEISFGTGNYTNVVRETRSGKTRNLNPKGEGTQRAWSLYTTSAR